MREIGWLLQVLQCLLDRESSVRAAAAAALRAAFSVLLPVSDEVSGVAAWHLTE